MGFLIALGALFVVEVLLPSTDRDPFGGGDITHAFGRSTYSCVFSLLPCDDLVAKISSMAWGAPNEMDAHGSLDGYTQMPRPRTSSFRTRTESRQSSKQQQLTVTNQFEGCSMALIQWTTR